MIAPDKTGYETTPDGYRLRFAVFRSLKRPNKGTIVLLHGRNEAIEKYDETIADFIAAGFDVGTFDWRGQGKSDRLVANAQRGYIEDFEQFAIDLEHIFTQVILPETRAPFFMVGHSMGGLAALYAAPRMANRIRRMVLSAPLLGLHEDVPSATILAPASKALCFLGLGAMPVSRGSDGIAENPFLNNRLTTDPVRYARNQTLGGPQGVLNLGPPTFAWLNATYRAIEYVTRIEHMARLHIPTLMVTAGADTVVESLASENYARNLRSGAHLTIDGARHELMQEADVYRDQFMAAVHAFIPGTSLS